MTRSLRPKRSPIFLAYTNPAIRYLKDGTLDFTPFFRDSSYVQGSLPQLLEGGVKFVSLSIGLVLPELFCGSLGVARLFQLISTFIAEVREHSELAELITSPSEFTTLGHSCKLGIVLHLTGVRLGFQVRLLEGFYQLGVRAIHPPFGEKGLTKDVIREMQKLGILIDLSHSSDRAFWQILRWSQGPIIASHSNCRALCPVQRNLTDRQIKAIAVRGGVIAVHFTSGFIDPCWKEKFINTGFYEELSRWEKNLRKKYCDPHHFLFHRFNAEKWFRSHLHRLQKSIPPPGLSMLIEHINRVVDIAGIDHIAVGGDYDLGSVPSEIDRAGKLQNLARALQESGYNKTELRKILYQNLIRIYREVMR